MLPSQSYGVGRLVAIGPPTSPTLNFNDFWIVLVALFGKKTNPTAPVGIATSTTPAIRLTVTTENGDVALPTGTVGAHVKF